MLAFDRPIFILSAPRSGSSFFYETIRRMHNTLSFERENDYTWQYFFPYARLKIPTDFVDISELTPEITSAIKSNLLWAKLTKPRLLKLHKAIKILLWDSTIRRKPLRYLEKTISNCFRIDVIDQIFPDALYIHLIRDGRANISSMIEGWDSEVFSKRILPFPENASISHWCYPVPPNWHKISHKPLEEICAWSWIEHNRYILDKHIASNIFRQRYIQISYEDFLSHPYPILEKIARFTELKISKASIEYTEKKVPSWTTVSPPKKDKWREKNFDNISRIESFIEPMMIKLGYKL